MSIIPIYIPFKFIYYKLYILALFLLTNSHFSFNLFHISPDIKNKTNQLKDAEERILKLERELRIISFSKSSSGGLITDPQCVQIYPGETKYLVSEAIRGYLSQIPADTRRAMILRSVVESKEDAPEEYAPELMQQYTSRIRQMFKDYTRLTSQMRNELYRMGFDISDEGKHYKLCLAHEKGGPSVIISKTPSDHRTGRNTASDIINAFF